MSVKCSKMLRSALCLFLAVLMAMGTCVTAFANELTDESGPAQQEPKETINYVSIGDSMANGYCFVGYEQGEKNGKLDFLKGVGVYGVAAYPLQFEEYLEGQDYDVNHTKLAVSALRAEDLYYLLGGRDEPRDGWQDQVNGYTQTDDSELAPYYQEAVKNADIITLGIGNASFGAYMLHRVTSALGVFDAELEGEELVDLEAALIDLDEEQKAVVLEAYNNLKADMKQYIPEELAVQYNVDAICDILAYTAAGFILNYKGSLERIIELNPDVEIVLVGLMNTTYGMTVTAEGMGIDPIPVGDIMDGFFSVLNAYVAALPAAMQAAGEWEEAEFYYAEQPNPLFISQQFAALKEANWGDIDEGRLSGTIVRERNITAYNDELCEMIAAAFSSDDWKMNLPKITLEEVKAFEESEPSWTLVANGRGFVPNGAVDGIDTSADEKNLSIAIYLAIEDAVAESTDTLEIPLEGLMTIADDIGSVFTNLEMDVTDEEVTPAKVRKTLGTYLTSTDTLKGMCKIYALFKVGNGMSVHPTPAGHDQIAESVIDAYENGHTAQDETIKNLDKAYNYAWQKAVESGALASAVEYLGIADNALIAAGAAVSMLPDSETKNLLLEEIGNTRNTIDAIEKLLSEGYSHSLWADYQTLKAEMDAHADTIGALANELGIVISPYVGKLVSACNSYAALLNAVSADAYAWLVENSEAFAEEYAAWVDAVASAAGEVDPRLEAPIREYLTNTPAEALAILYAYGADALTRLLFDYSAAAGDVYGVLAGLNTALYNHKDEILYIIEKNTEVQELQDDVKELHDQLMGIYNEMLTKPITTALSYQTQIDALKTELLGLYDNLVAAVISASGDVSPELGCILTDGYEALFAALRISGFAGSDYAEWLGGHAADMAGALMAMFLTNTELLGEDVLPVIGELVANLGEELWGYGTEVYDQVYAFVTVCIPSWLSAAKEDAIETAEELWDAYVQPQIDALIEWLIATEGSIDAAAAELYELLVQYKAEIDAAIAQAEEDIKNEIARIEAELDALYAQLANASAEGREEILAKIAALEAELAAKQQELAEAVKAALAQIDAELPGKLEAAYNEFVAAACAWAKEIAPEVDEYLYSYLYNNPAEVIGFFREYGPDAIDFILENKEAFAAVLGFVVITFGDDIADYVMNNPEEVLSAMIGWYKEHGEETWDLIWVYLEELGIIDAVVNNIEDAVKQLCGLLTQYEAEIDAALAQVEESIKSEIARIEAELEALYEELANASGAAREEILAQIEALEAELAAKQQELAEAVKAALAQIDAELPGKLEAAYNEFVAAACAWAKEIAPEVDEYLYSYLYNNPAEVIGFFREYGPDAIDFILENKEAFAAVLGFVVITFGDDIADYVMNNPEEVLSAMIGWYKEHGEETWDLIWVYLEELGIIETVVDTVTDPEKMKAVFEELLAVLEQYGPEMAQKAWDYALEQGYVAAAQQAVNDLLAKAQADLEAWLTDPEGFVNASVSELQAQLDALKEALAAAESELNDQVLAQIAALQAQLDSLNEQLLTATGEAKAQIEAAIAVIEAAIAALEAEAAALEADIAALCEQIAIIEEKIAELVGKVSEVGEKLVALVEQALALNETLETLVAGGLESLEENIDAVVNAISTGVDTIVALAAEVQDVIASAQALAEEIAALIESAIAAVDERINGFAETIESINAAMAAGLAPIIEALDCLADAIGGLNEEAEAQIAALEAQIASILADAEAAAAAIRAQYEEQIAALEQAVADAQAALNAAVSEELAALKAELEAQIAALEAELAAKLAELDAAVSGELAARKAELEAQIEALKAELEAKKAELEAAAEDVRAEIEAAIAEIEAAIAEAEAALLEVNAQLQAVVAEIEAAIAEIEAAIAEAEAALLEVNAQIQDAIAEFEQALADAEAALNAKLAEMDAAVAAVIAQAEAQVAELQAQIDALIAEAEAQIDQAAKELAAAAAQQLETVKTALNTAAAEIAAAAVAAAEELAAEVAAEVIEAAEALGAVIDEQLLAVGEVVDGYVLELVDALEAAYIRATTGEYELSDTNYYVALGDGSAVSESYVDLLAAELELEDAYVNLAEDGLLPEELLEELAAGNMDYISEIAKADLITVGFSPATFANEQIARFANAEDLEEMDWLALVGEKGMPYVEDAMAELDAYLAETGIEDEFLLGTISTIVESYAYSVVSFGATYAVLVDAIHEISPNAEVIIIGSYNAFNDVEFVFGESALPMGEYMEQLTELVNAYMIAYALIAENTTYVDVTDTETVLSFEGQMAIDPTDIKGLIALLNMLQAFEDTILPTADGHEYIKNQILGVETIIEPEEPTGIWGDADSDGDVDNIDAMLVLRYYTGAIDESKLNLKVCDVDGVNSVNNIDSMQILRRYTGAISKFPVE